MMTYECLIGKIPFRVYTEMDLNKIVSYLCDLGIRLSEIPRLC